MRRPVQGRNSSPAIHRSKTIQSLFLPLERPASRCRPLGTFIPEPVQRTDCIFAYPDERTKRKIRRAILNGIASPGQQVPFANRETPMPYGWGTGGVRVSAACLAPEAKFKVIDQVDGRHHRCHLDRHVLRTDGGCRDHRAHGRGQCTQVRHRIPETPPTERQILVDQVRIPEPLRFLEPGASRGSARCRPTHRRSVPVSTHGRSKTPGQIAPTTSAPPRHAGRRPSARRFSAESNNASRSRAIGSPPAGSCSWMSPPAGATSARRRGASSF